MAARQAGEIVLDALGCSPLFVRAALPFEVSPPLVNRYEVGNGFGTRVDTVIRIRRDLSATLFLAEPDIYEGDELAIADQQDSKQAAVDQLLDPASTLHSVDSVRHGVRVAAFISI